MFSRSQPAAAGYRPGSVIPPRELLALPRTLAEELCRERARPVYVGDQQVMSRLLTRYKFISSSTDTAFAPHIIMDGYWEMWLTRWLARELPEGATALDVGANYGYFSVLMADLVGPAGRLIAVEPHPESARCAAFSLSINGFADRSTVHAAAAGREAGRTTLHVPHHQPSNASLARQTLGDLPCDELPVPMICLDDLGLDRVDLIKIDAESAEYDIFRGLQRTLDAHNPWLILEYHPARPEADRLAQLIRDRYPQPRVLTGDEQLLPFDFDQPLAATEHLLVLRS